MCARRSKRCAGGCGAMYNANMRWDASLHGGAASIIAFVLYGKATADAVCKSDYLQQLSGSERLLTQKRLRLYGKEVRPLLKLKPADSDLNLECMRASEPYRAAFAANKNK